MFGRKIRRLAEGMADPATFDVTDVRQLLGAADPAAGALDAAATTSIALIKEQFTGDRANAGSGRTWWPRRPQRLHRKVVITCIAGPALLAATAGAWVAVQSPPAVQVAPGVTCYSAPLHSNVRPFDAIQTESDGQSPVAICALLGQWQHSR